MPSLTTRAERALLGALLAGPPLARNIPPLAEVGFASREHADLYQAIATRTGNDLDWTWLPGTAIGGASPPYLHTLARSCPQPGHADWYARLVIEAGLQPAAHTRPPGHSPVPGRPPDHPAAARPGGAPAAARTWHPRAGAPDMSVRTQP